MDVSQEILNATILIVDDEPANVKLLTKTLALHGYHNIISTEDPRETLSLFTKHQADIVLLDLNMPYMSGFEVMQTLKDSIDNDYLPVVVLSAQTDQESRLKALQTGARDFISKPFDQQELITRLHNNLETRMLHLATRNQNKILEERVQQRTKELHDTRLEIIQRLGMAAEYRDNETGLHIIRMSLYSTIIAKSSGLDADACELILNASPMHDIGKIGIPDSILLKPGKLTVEEWTIMKSHPTIGAELLDGHDAELMVMARSIALNHHEQWSGNGYPHGIKGEDIPLAARIVAIADVFDALTTPRPYKDAWPVDEAVHEINKLSGKQFEPRLVEVFNRILPDLLAIKTQHEEPAPETRERHTLS